MDKLTELINGKIVRTRNHHHLPQNIEGVTLNRIREGKSIDSLSWLSKHSPLSLPTKTLSIKYDWYGAISISCAAEVIVNHSELSNEKWIISHMDIKGGDPDNDVTVKIREVSRGYSQTDCFLLGDLTRKWPHLREQMNVWLELGLIVQDSVFDLIVQEVIPGNVKTGVTAFS